jgi:Dolichyl-phosphate-mannose-protein mannosyltransferase
MGIRSGPALAKWAPPALLVGLSSAVWAWEGLRVHGPWFIPDEVVYAELGKSLYRLGHFEVLGARPSFFSLVYPLFVGPPLLLAGIERGYAVAKELQAVAMSLAAVPVYCLARSVVSRRWALVAAALALALPALALTGFLMTEVLFYPLFCLAAWLMARVLVRPTLGLQALALGSILLTALTRVQGLLLAPAFLLAMVLAAALGRTGLRPLRRLTPSIAALALGAVLWLALALATGRSPLGAYEVTLGGHYAASEALRFLVYHAADLILLTGVVPVAALMLLTGALLQRRETAPEVVALVSVTIGTTLVFVPFVAVYATGFTGRIAERNLFFLAPLFFTSFVVWLKHGAPRPALGLGATSAVLLALVLSTPWDRFVVPAAEPDAFTFVSFVDLQGRYPGAEPAVVIGVLAACLLAVLALPRRLLLFAPLVVGLLLAGAAVSAARYAASTAGAYEYLMVGSDHRWVDKAAPGPVDFLYAGERSWSGGGPVWTNLFWNDRIERVDDLFGGTVAGASAAQAHRDFVARDGSVVTASSPLTEDYVVASTRLELAGTQLASSYAGLVLWQIDPPLRIVSRIAGLDPGSGTLEGSAQLIAYRCRGGSAHLVLLAPDNRVVQVVTAGGAPAQQVSLMAGVVWQGDFAIPAPAQPGVQTCELSLTGTAGVRALELSFHGG